jgi:hypothetical protein
MMILMILLFIIGLFSTMATGMNDIPPWITKIFSHANAKYLWGIITAVKYSLFVGTSLVLILTISYYVSNTLDIVKNPCCEQGDD